MSGLVETKNWWEGIRTKSHGRYCPIIQTFKGRHILVLQIKERSIFVISGSLGQKLLEEVGITVGSRVYQIHNIVDDTDRKSVV